MRLIAGPCLDRAVSRAYLHSITIIEEMPCTHVLAS